MVAQRRALAVAVSAALHAAFFAWLVWHLGRSFARPEPPVFQVELAPAWRFERPSTPRPDAEPALGRLPPLEVLTGGREALGPPAPPTVADPWPAPESDARRALRGLVGCAHAGLLELSDAERRDCQRRTAGRAGEAPMRIDLSRRGLYAADDPEPYLTRKPRNGCKAAAGGDVTPSGDHGAAAGVSCGWAF